MIILCLHFLLYHADFLEVCAQIRGMDEHRPWSSKTIFDWFFKTLYILMYIICVNVRSTYLFKGKRGFDSPSFVEYMSNIIITLFRSILWWSQTDRFSSSFCKQMFASKNNLVILNPISKEFSFPIPSPLLVYGAARYSFGDNSLSSRLMK